MPAKRFKEGDLVRRNPAYFKGKYAAHPCLYRRGVVVGLLGYSKGAGTLRGECYRVRWDGEQENSWSIYQAGELILWGGKK